MKKYDAPVTNVFFSLMRACFTRPYPSLFYMDMSFKKIKWKTTRAQTPKNFIIES